MKTFVFSASLLAIGMACSVPAYAQNDNGAEAEADQRNAIIVTASRREESVQDSSLIISAISGDDLARDGIVAADDLSKAVTGVEIGAAGGALQVFVRGVGNPGSTAVTNPAVPVNVDGVYVARSQATAGNFFDLERVEVLKGPQGTLYGRNASGGAINLIPVRPRLGEVNGYVSAELGNFDLYSFEGALNIPLGDSIALRASGQVINRDGYMTDGTGDDVHESARLQILIEPSDALSINLWANYGHQGGRGTGFSYVGAPDPWTAIFPGGTDILFAGAAQRGLIAPQNAFPPGIDGPIAGQAPPPPNGPGGNLLFLVDDVRGDAYSDQEFWGIHATIEADLGFADLTIIPAYQEADLLYKIQPGLNFEARGILENDAPESSEATSLEVRLAGGEGALDWIVGGYYFDESQRVYNVIANGLVQNLIVQANLDTESLGVFADVTLHATETARILAGIRYSEDEIVKSNFERFAFLPAIGPTLCHLGNAQEYNGVLACPINTAGPAETAKFDDISWKIGGEIDLSPDNMLFATASTGYKSGGQSLVAGAPFAPETLTAFTIGSRNLFLDGDLMLNFELFYWIYNDHQEFLIGPDAAGIVGQRIVNAGKAYARGVSLDLAFTPTPNDSLGFSIEYNDAGYDSFSYQQSAQFTSPLTACALSDTGQPANDPAFNILDIDCSALSLSRAPKWSGLASYAHDFDLADGSVITAGVDAKFASSRWTSVAFLPGELAPSYQLVNGNITYTSPDDSFSVTAYVRNIFEDANFSNANAHTVVSDLIGITVGAPRTYGIRASYNF